MDKELLFKPRLPEAELEIEGVGTIRVRALNRDEAFAVQQLERTEAAERKLLALGMVDPQITESEAFRWQQASPAGELETITNKISALSGLLREAPKSGVPADGDGPGHRVRDVPGAEAVDDSGPAPGADE